MAKGGVKFKDTVAAYDRLRGEITARKFAPVYLLMGEEAFFIDALCDLLASTILQESERAFNQLTVYGRDSDAGQVVNLCRQMPMMGSYQVVILKEAQQLRGLDKLSLYTSKTLAHDDPDRLPQGEERGQAFAALQKHRPARCGARIGPAARLRDRPLARAVRRLERLHDRRESPGDADRPPGYRPRQNLQRTGQAAALAAGRNEEITDAHIEQNIGISKDFNNFELCKAVTEQNLEQALRIADHFARNPKDNPLLVTILALSISSAKFSASTTCGGSAATREFRFPRTRNSWASCE